MNSINSYPVGMALWTVWPDGDTGRNLPGIASVRVLRFRRRTRLEQLMIHPVPVRWQPELPASPAHIEVSVFDPVASSWRIVLQTDLPPMESVVASPHILPLHGLETDHLRVTCDLEHPVPPSHGEQWANPRFVPFKTLARLCEDLCRGFDEDRFMGGVGAGNEFYTQEGLATGYEGALVGVPHALLAVARHLGLADIPSPEWWGE